MASPLTFDPSVVEIFTTLSSGATLLILDEWMRLRPRDLAVLLTTVYHVTVLQVMMMMVRTFLLAETPSTAFEPYRIFFST